MNLLAIAAILAASTLSSRAHDLPNGANAGQRIEADSEVADLVAQIAAIPTVESVELAPDGESVVFGLRELDRGANRSRLNWWFQRLDTGHRYRVGAADDASIVRWLPASGELLVLAKDGGAATLRRIALRSNAAVTVREYSLGSQSISSLSISMRGDRVAMVSERKVADPSPSPDQPLDYETWQRLRAPSYGLHILDLTSGELKRFELANASLSPYGEPSWSPDGRSLAVTMDYRPNSQNTDTAVAVLDMGSGSVRIVADEPGMDANPVWSPDGGSIVYFSHHGVPKYRAGRPTVLDLDSGKVTRFAEEQGPGFTFFMGSTVWKPDSRGFYYVAAARMKYDLVRLQVSGTAFEPCSALLMGDSYIASRSFSRDRRRMAFSASTPTDPPQVYVVDLDEAGCPQGEGRAIWEQAAYALFKDRVKFEEMSWESGDRLFRIHGTLLAPVVRDKPMPGLLYLRGGPDMVTADFSDYVWQRVRLVLALRGFAVLTPNTRGRGGYGERFQDGIRDGNRTALPFQDAVLGLDRLIDLGVVDRRRQAVAGFSYGGLLSAYAITQTRRFRAAVVHEGAADMMRFAYPAQPGTYQVLSMRELGGITDPFDPPQWRAIIDQSPGFNMMKADTPTLLLYGAHSLVDDGRRLWQTMLRYEVPVRFLVYDEGHAFAAPSSLISSMNETVSWIEKHVSATP